MAEQPLSTLSPHEVAYLSEGPRLAVTASLGALRTHGAIGTAGRRALTTTGTLPADAAPLDQAIYNSVASGRGKRASTLPLDYQVRTELDQLEERLVSGGHLLSAAARRQLRYVTLPLVAVVAIGAVRWWSGWNNDRPIGFLSLALVALIAIEVIVLTRGQRITKRGKRALGSLRAQYAHLSPASQPAWGLYGATGAAMAVGLFGGAALWAADPAFAADAELQQRALGSSGTSSSGCGAGSSCSSSGSSCGGGGGCGGGGCGG
jgi:uncharacterized protein (TIGR04222 family)